MNEDDSSDAPSMTPEELHGRLSSRETLSILDLRDRDEVETWAIDGPGVTLTQAPMMRFVAAEAKGAVDDLASDLDLVEPVVVVCGRGEASDHVASLLNEAGIEARNLAGGMDAWARLYLSAEIDAGGATTVVQYHRPSSGCVAYLLVSGEEAVVVDPLRAFTDRYVEDAAQWDASITAAVDTHVHADHVSGVRDLAAEAGATPVVPVGAVDRGLAFDAETIEDGETIAFGDATLEAIHTPGHTTEMTSFRLADLLLSGDGLFLHSVARPDLEQGSDGARDLAGTLHATLRGLLARPGDTVVAPGHLAPAAESGKDGTYTATLSTLQERLDLLSLDRNAFVDRILADMPPRPANYERIIEINLGRETTDAEEAFELELGPNNCAVSA